MSWYEKYLESEHWQRTRLKRLMMAEIDGSFIRCEECKLWLPLSVINVYHNTYENLHEEEMEDLNVWCRACHAVHHGYPAPIWHEAIKKSGRDWASEAFIREYSKLKTIGEILLERVQYYDLEAALQQAEESCV